MKITLTFDVCGTLVDPSRMTRHLAEDVGPRAGEFAECWMDKQVEYTFRRGLMRSEEDVYGPWGVGPNVTVSSLIDLPAALTAGS